MLNDRILCTRVVPMPADLNINGDVFGGYVLAQMDVAGAIAARRVTGGRLATVAVDSMKFLRPIHAGHIVTLYGQVTKVGTTSVSVQVETFTQKDHEEPEILVTEGKFVYVAIDDTGCPRPIDLL
ncbi:MAG: acyl-CoA thioesterase [Alphaproteobacteria bacterium]